MSVYKQDHDRGRRRKAAEQESGNASLEATFHDPVVPTQVKVGERVSAAEAASVSVTTPPTAEQTAATPTRFVRITQGLVGPYREGAIVEANTFPELDRLLNLKVVAFCDADAATPPDADLAAVVGLVPKPPVTVIASPDLDPLQQAISDANAELKRLQDRRKALDTDFHDGQIRLDLLNDQLLSITREMALGSLVDDADRQRKHKSVADTQAVVSNLQEQLSVVDEEITRVTVKLQSDEQRLRDGRFEAERQDAEQRMLKLDREVVSHARDLFTALAAYGADGFRRISAWNRLTFLAYREFPQLKAARATDSGHVPLPGERMISS